MTKAVRPSTKYLPLNEPGEMSYGLPEFVEALRHYASRYAVGGPEDGVADEIKERTVRHYQAQGVIDRPGKHGREARYTRRHLLQMLAALKARASTGISPRALAGSLPGLSDDALMEMLQKGVRVSFDAAQEPEADAERVNLGAMDKLAAIFGRDLMKLAGAAMIPLGESRPSDFMTQRQGLLPRRERQLEDELEENAATASLTGGETWRRFRIDSGIELMIRSDVGGNLTDSLIACLGRELLLHRR